ncbi:hypothetical protein AAFC00_000585 [Neodothiora populina]|uniref:Ubiquitin-like protease family profile domain-containing protein n=1 Tax=Neodothiora populina TaxID=2781224 RepID=A0ABR3PDD2_9PEZI
MLRSNSTCNWANNCQPPQRNDIHNPSRADRQPVHHGSSRQAVHTHKVDFRSAGRSHLESHPDPLLVDDTPSYQMTRRLGGASFRPTNTLGSNAFGEGIISRPRRSHVHVLDIASHAGDNVPATANPQYFEEHGGQKRRRLNPPSEVEVVQNRNGSRMRNAPYRQEPASSPNPGSRKLSTQSVPSQDSQKPSRPGDPFACDESRDMNTVLGPAKKKSRKPKSSPDASNPQIDTGAIEIVEIPDSQDSTQVARGGRSNAALDIQRSQSHKLGDTDVSVAGQRSNQSQSLLRQPNHFHSERARSPTIQIPSISDVLSSKQNTRTAPTKQDSSPASPMQSRHSHKRAIRDASPPLSQTFARDTERPSTSNGSLRKRMLASSDVGSPQTQTKKRPFVIGAVAEKIDVESSEDELANGSVTIRKSPRSIAHGAKSWFNAFSNRAPSNTSKQKKLRDDRLDKSENHDVLDSNTEVRLASIFTLSVDLGERDDLSSEYIPEEGQFIVKRQGQPAMYFHNKPYALSSKHAQSMIANPAESLRIGMRGAKDDITGGEVWMSFYTREDLELFKAQVTRVCVGKHVSKILTGREIEKSFERAREIIDFERKRSEPRKINIDSNDNPMPLTAVPKQSSAASEHQRSFINDEVQQPHEGQKRPSSDGVSVLVKHPGRETISHNEYGGPVNDRRESPLKQQPTTTPTSKPTRNSNRLQRKHQVAAVDEAEPERWTQQHGPLNWDAPLIYPSTGAKRTTVDVTDIERLDDGEFLNDNIISFCLRHLEEQHPEATSKVHIFNTFFYTALSTKQGRRAFNYDAVKRWTKNIDIFSLPFVVVPVNVNLHWFVTIICNLDKLSRRLVDDDEEDAEGVQEEDETTMLDDKLKTGNMIENGLVMELPDSQEDQSLEPIRKEVHRMSFSDNELEERKVARPTIDISTESGHTDALESTERTPKQARIVSRKGKKRVAPPLPKVNPDQPVIITLDSLGGTHGPEVRNLKDYLIQEAQEKRGMSIKRDDLRGLLARGIPEQTNFCDCGVYLVGYVAEFLKNPCEFVRKVLSREMDKNNDFADFDPARKRAEIRDELIRLERQQREDKRSKKKARRNMKNTGLDGAADSSPVPAGSGRHSAVVEHKVLEEEGVGDMDERRSPQAVSDSLKVDPDESIDLSVTEFAEKDKRQVDDSSTSFLAGIEDAAAAART